MNKLLLLFSLFAVVFSFPDQATDLAFGKGVYFGDHATYKARDAQTLQEVGKILESEIKPVSPTDEPGLDARHGMLHLLHASLHNDKKPVTLPNGSLINELSPPVRVTANRIAKVRRIPNHAGEIVRKVPVDATLVATGMTPDMLWLQVGKDMFILTRDCKLEGKLDAHYNANNRNGNDVVPLNPALPVHVQAEVTVRKMPSVNGKSVGLLQPGDMVSAIGATPDYTWLQIGRKQFIPTTFAKLGDPTTPLNPPVAIHISAETVQVRDIPSYEGSVVTTLNKGDVLNAIAVSADLKWIKVAKNNYVPSVATKVGLPHPPSIRFPEPVAVKLIEQTVVVKNPNEPKLVVRTLEKDDEVLAIGSTEDFQWLELAHKRYIPIASARLMPSIPEPLKLDPPVPIKMGTDTPVRHIPDMRGRTMTIVRKGDRMEAIAVSADFSWLMVAPNMFVPVAATFIRRADPVLNPVIPTMNITLKADAKVFKRPGDDEKYVRTIPMGTTLKVTAATPDLTWIKIGEKQFIKSEAATIGTIPDTTPLTPPVKVVVIRDTKMFKAPDSAAMVTRRIKRGETLKAAATTTDLKWLVLSDNEYILTDDVAHVATTTPLTPAVRVTIASNVAARNVPAFSGRSVKALNRGEVLSVIEVTHDYKWFKIGKHMYIPASACTLHETEGKNMLLVVKARNNPLLQESDPLVHPAVRSDPPPEPQTVEAKQDAEAKLKALRQNAVREPVDMQPVRALRNLRITENTFVFSRPTLAARRVRELAKGTLVTATAIDSHLKWIQIAPEEFVLVDATAGAEIPK